MVFHFGEISMKKSAVMTTDSSSGDVAEETDKRDSDAMMGKGKRALSS